MHLPEAPAPQDPWCADMPFGSHCPPGVTPETDVTRHRQLGQVEASAAVGAGGQHCSMKTGMSMCSADTQVTTKQINQVSRP